MDPWIYTDRPSHPGQSHVLCSTKGIENEVKSMLNNGSLSWIVIYRGPNRYVDELYEEEEPSHDEEMASGTSIEKSIATKQQERSSPPANPSSKTLIPIGQREWNEEGDNSVLTWRSSSIIWQNDWLEFPVTHATLRFRKWRCWKFLEFTMAGSYTSVKRQKRLQYCMDLNDNLIFLRAFNGHSGGALVDPAFAVRLVGKSTFTTWEVPWQCIPSCKQGWLMAGGKGTKEGRQTVFFTARDPMGNEPDEEYQDLFETKKGTVQKQVESHSGRNYWINLRKAQDKGLTFWQTTRFHAIILYDSVPADCIERVVSTAPTPRPPPKILLKEAWQVQHDKRITWSRDTTIHPKPPSKCKEYHRKQYSKIENERPGSNSRRIPSKLIPERSQWSLIYRKLVCSTHSVRSPKEPSIASVGQVSAKTQCPSCAESWPEGIMYCTCGQCLLPSDEQRGKTKE